MNTASERIPEPSIDAPIKPLSGADHGLALVVADRGHVWLGRAITRGDWTHVAGARVVRRWGTTDGLNMLVQGPRPATKLDAPADLKVATRAVIAIIPVEEAAWPNA